MGRTERLSQPQSFGKYELVARLAHGRMGDVYKAKSHGVEGFEKILVVKVLNPALTQIPNFVDTVIEEAKRTVTLSHANVAQVYDLGMEEESGQYYIAQEYCGGFDLGRTVELGHLVDRPLSRELALFLVSEIAKGLDYAHRRKDYNFNSLNLLHGDISPRNIMLTFEGEVKITDFGMARALALVPVIDNEDEIQRLLYEAPEVLRGHARTQKADIFSLGLLLYELLSGTHPYAGHDLDETRKVATEADIPPIHSITDVPRPLVQILESMLVPDPAGRASNAGSLYEELVAFIFGNNLRADTRALSLYMQELKREEMRVAPDETTMEVGLEEISLTDLQILGMDEESEPSPVTDSTNAELPSYKLQNMVGGDQRPALPGSLEDLFASVRAGQGKAILVSGEFGAGRNYLPDRLPDALGWRGATRAFGMRVNRDDRYCPFGIMTDFLFEFLEVDDPGKVVEKLRELGVRDEALDTVSSLWMLTGSRAVGARIKRRHLLQVIDAVLDEATSAGPLVLVIDRIDRIDHVSLDVLRHVVGDIGGRSFMLVMCTQSPEQIRSKFDIGKPENLAALRVIGEPGPNFENVSGLTPDASACFATLGVSGHVMSQSDLSQILGIPGERIMNALQQLTEQRLVRVPKTGHFMAVEEASDPWLDATLERSEIEQHASAIARHIKHRRRPTDMARYGPAMTRWYALAGDRRRLVRDARQVARWLELEGWLDTVLEFFQYTSELIATHQLGAPQTRVAFMLNRAELALVMAKLDVCRNALEPVNALAEMLRDDVGAIRGRLLRGQLSMQQDDLVDAFHHFRLAIEAARAINDPDLLAYGMLSMARWQDRYGDTVAAQSMLEGAMNLYQRWGTYRMDLSTRALMLNRAVRMLTQLGMDRRASEIRDNLRVLAESTGLAVVSCRADWAEACIFAAESDWEVARSFLARAQQLASDHGLTALGIELIREDAAYALEAKQYDLVVDLSDRLIEEGHAHQDFYSAQRGHDFRATAQCLLGNGVEDALNHLATSLARARERDVPKDIYRCHRNLAVALEATGRGSDANVHREAAAALAREMRLEVAA